MLLSLTDGTTTLTLSGSGSYHGVTYFPISLSLSEAAVAGARVTEEVSLIVRAASAALMADAVADVERLLRAARQAQATAGSPRVYVQYQAYDGGQTGRSEVFDGDVAFDTSPGARRLAGDAVRVFVTLERAAFWEGDLTQLISDKTLTNADGSNSTYTSTAIAGVLPAPVKFTLENPSGSTEYPNHVFLGCNVFGEPSTFDGTFATKSFSWTAPRTFDSSWVATWTPTAGQLAAIGSLDWRVLVAFTGGATDDTFYRMQWNYGAVNVIAKTNEAYMTTDVDDDVVDLGAMAIPNIGDPAMGGVTLELVVASEETSGSDALAFVQLMPADNCRWLDVFGGLGPGDEIVDDGIEGYAYVQDGSVRNPQVYADGEPLMVYPGQAHRFSWLYSANGYSSTHQTLLNVWYRPRWLTVT